MVSLKHSFLHKSAYYDSRSFTSRGLEKYRHHRRRRRRRRLLHHRRGSIRRSRLRSRVNASGRPYLPTTTRQHLDGTSIPSRNRRAGAEFGGERASKRASAAAATAVRVPTLSRRRTRARARSPPTSNWIPSEAL